ncbi:1-deoxy-D-xylulose-5-phosphate synthase [candidate division KSB1 bacterium]
MLEIINSPADLKKLTIPDLAELAKELRSFIIDTVSETGGHLAPTLGVIELTIALHYVFNTPIDKIVWDVGHQAYAHKIITGRKDNFSTIRQYNGLSGFPKITESEYDTFGVGHASTSISAALGLACSRDLKKEDYKVLAVLGDGALTGGEAFEGLNNAGALKKDMIVVLNDNKMSISKNVGALPQYLAEIISTPAFNKVKADIWNLTEKLSKFGKKIQDVVRRVDNGIKAVLVPGLLFERLGFSYIGPIDGHSLSTLIRIFRHIKMIKGPVFVHIITKKGKGYKFAEENASKFHGIGSFEKNTGNSLSADPEKTSTYSKLFGNVLCKIAEKNEKVVAITAAMCDGTGLTEFRETFPDRFFDVGIAEQHAITFAGGLSLGGFKPVVAIYSTFLQRSFDQIIHDIALQNLNILFAIDRGGLVGDDGPTHHGTFDLSYLRLIPNMVIMSPKDEFEFRDMIWTAVNYKGPVAIRFPRAKARNIKIDANGFNMLPIGKGELVCEGKKVAILTLGRMIDNAIKAKEILGKEIEPAIYNLKFVKPLDKELLRNIFKEYSFVITLEENTLIGGFGGAVSEFIVDEKLRNAKIYRIGLPDNFITHGSVDILFKISNLDPESIANAIRKLIISDRKLFTLNKY